MNKLGIFAVVFLTSSFIQSCGDMNEFTYPRDEIRQPVVSRTPKLVGKPTQNPTNTSSPTRTPFPTNTPRPSPTTMAYWYINPPEGYELASPDCTLVECLFRKREERNWNILNGVAIIEGYYVKRTRTAWGLTADCDSLIITGGSQTMIDSINGLIDEGNAIYTRNEQQQVIAMLDLDSIDPPLRSAVLRSNLSSTVKILAFWPIPGGRASKICESPLIILSVE